MSDVTAHRCPQCYADPGKQCRRRFQGQKFTTPCVIRQVMADRQDDCPADQLQLGNDVLCSLWLAAKKDLKLKQLYRKLVGESRDH